jgi:site-specific DNA recombinase
VKAAGYVRVSTGRQAERGLSLEEQERRVRERAAREGWELVEVFVERGVTGRKASRPALDRLLARLREFDVVVAPKLDRLGRGGVRQGVEFKAKLDDAGVKLVVLEPDIDFDTSVGRIIWAVLLEVAAWESEAIAERTASVSEARARAGRHHGPAPYGYQRVAERPGELVPAPSEAVVVRRMFEASARGLSNAAIARELMEDGLKPRRGKRWAPPVIGQRLRDPVYIGKVRHKDQVFDGTHEPLVAVELFDRVQALVSARQKGPGHGKGRWPSHAFLFHRGMLRCYHCGYPMYARSGTKGGVRYDYYACQGRRDYGADFCPMTPIPRADLDAAAFAYFQEVGLDLEATERQLRHALTGRIVSARVLREDAEAEVAKLQARLERLRDDYLDRVVTAEEWRTLKEPLEAELAGARSRLEKLVAHVEALVEAREVDDAEQRVLERIAALQAAVAGEVNDPEDISAVRAALQRLFEGFVVARTDQEPDPDMPPALVAAREAWLAEEHPDQVKFGSWLMLPEPRPEQIVTLGEEWRPVLEREALLVSPENEGLGTSRFVFDNLWRPFLVKRR